MSLKVEVLGVGCPKCKKLLANAQAAVKELNRDDIELEKIKEIQQITARGIMMTPALVINGQVKSTGKVLSTEQIKKLLEE